MTKLAYLTAAAVIAQRANLQLLSRRKPAEQASPVGLHVTDTSSSRESPAHGDVPPEGKESKAVVVRRAVHTCGICSFRRCLRVASRLGSGEGAARGA